MPIVPFSEFDLSNDSVCSFLSSSDARLIEKPGIVGSIVEQGYLHDPIRDREIPTALITPGPSEIELHVFEKTRWLCEESSSRRPITNYETTQVIAYKCRTGIVAQLYISSGANPSNQTKIIDCFELFDFQRLAGEGINYVRQVENGLTSDGVDIYEYYVVIAYLVEKIASKAGLDTLPSLRNALGEDYNLVEIGKESSCQAPDNTFDPHEVEIQPGDDPIPAINRKLEEVASAFDCTDLEYYPYRVGTLFKYPEWKVIWVLKEFRIGGCRIVKTKVPSFYHRFRKNILFVSATTPKSLRSVMEKKVLECLATAAAAVGLLALFTGGIGMVAGGTAFSNAFSHCIQVQFGRTVMCVINDVYIVAEAGDWIPGLF